MKKSDRDKKNRKKAIKGSFFEDERGYIDKELCFCPCHTGQKIQHIQPCCLPCPICEKIVKSEKMQKHKKLYHPTK